MAAAMDVNRKPLPPTKHDTVDHSNTQFAVLALWVARRHGMPVDYALWKTEQRFRALQIHIAFRVQQQPDPGGVDRIAHYIDEAADVLRHAEAYRHVEHFFGELNGPLHFGAAAGEHDAGRHRLLQASAAQLISNQPE